MASSDHSRRSQLQLHLRRKSSMGKGLQQTRLSFQGTSYVKNLEFPADGPGRVIVRLERLMGSDRIRITDTKYMATLLQRLEEEEEITWQKRTRERRKAEHNRFRQLVIDGYMDPTPAMEDLYNHPVFRVNRILNRLNRLDSNVRPAINLPPIVSVDPFQFDDTGRAFKLYPGHFSVAQITDKETTENPISVLELEPLSHAPLGQIGEAVHYTDTMPEILELGTDAELEQDEDEYEEDDKFEEDEEEENITGEHYSTIIDPKRTEEEIALSRSYVQKPSGNILQSSSSAKKSPGNMLSTSVDKRSGHIKLSPAASQMERHLAVHIGASTATNEMKTGKIERKDDVDAEIESETQGPRVITLLEIQKKYGVAPNTDLGTQWKPYQSQVVDTLFHDQQRGVWDLYEMGTAITDMYDRQQQTTDEYIAALNRKNEKIRNEMSRVNGKSEDYGEEEEEFDDGYDEVPPLTDIDEYLDYEEENDTEQEDDLEPLTQRLSDFVQPPTWDNLDEMWEDDGQSVEEGHENEGKEE